MIASKIAVVGVLYPKVAPYIDSYIHSLERQTYDNFDLILMNDGWNGAEISFQDTALSFEIHDTKGSPAKIRADLIKKVLDLGYEKIIFTDCDDHFSRNRIKTSITELEGNDIVVNDLDIFSGKNEVIETLYLSNRMKERQIIKFKDLIHCNMMGMSNTSANSNVLKRCLPFLGADLVAFDWLLWTYALHFNFKAIFTSTATTKYRTHPENIAGMPQRVNKKEVLQGISIKAAHYGELLDLDTKFKKLYNDFCTVLKKTEDPVWLDNYIHQLNNQPIYKPMWWENIIILKEAIK